MHVEIEDGQAAQRARGEIEAIDAELQRAFDRILDTVERLSTGIESLDSKASGLVQQAVNDLLETSAARDIVGQRLVAVRLAVDRLEGMGGQSEGSSERNRDKASKIDEKQGVGSTSESGLLNGPQMPGTAKSQVEVDALFENLD